MSEKDVNAYIYMYIKRMVDTDLFKACWSEHVISVKAN